MQKIYIAGSGGMLGDAFYQVFNKDYELKCSDIDLNEDWLSYMDFRDEKKYKEDVHAFNPDFLFHIGAHTSLEFCEENKDDTYLTNTISVEYGVQIANDLNIPILYISTAGIFDGKKDLYDDWDQPNPLGVYARSKFLGERYVVENATKYIVCRAGWMMGAGPKKDKKFINKIMNQIKNGSEVLNVVDDKDGTPTFTIDFANNCKILIEQEQWGLYNMVCGGETSRLDVAKEILSIIGMQDKISINAVDSEFFSEEYYALRPPNERLVNKRLNLKNLNMMRDWKVALKEYLNSYYSDYID